MNRDLTRTELLTLRDLLNRYQAELRAICSPRVRGEAPMPFTADEQLAAIATLTEAIEAILHDPEQQP